MNRGSGCFLVLALALGASLSRAEGQDGCVPVVGADPEEVAAVAQKEAGAATWGITGLRGFPYSDQMAPNGLEFKALFAIDLDLNIWLCRPWGLYLSAQSTFWGQRAAPGITNPSQGIFDFSKRELDFTAGLAWNYWGPLEARVFAYSMNNLNRGFSPSRPTGYADGVGLEQRYYVSDVYADLGTVDFDLARASFVSLGYYPTKDMVNSAGDGFRPGAFARGYLTLDLGCPRYYLFVDAQLITARSWTPAVFKVDGGFAARPLESVPHLEFRIGSSDFGNPRTGENEVSIYGQIRLLF
jgi:hypothetical protein